MHEPPVAAGQAWAGDAKYRTLADSIDEGFCVVEVLFDGADTAVDYRFLEVNPAFERQTGFTDAVGRSMRALAPTHEQFWFDTYGRVAREGGSIRFEHRADALARTYDVCAFRVGDPLRRWVGLLFNDITDRVAARQALVDAARRKDEFMAVLAHELRNPLAPMRHAIGLLQLGTASPAAVARAVQILDRQVTHMTALVHDLTDIGRIARGVVSVDFAPVDAAEIAHRAAETAQPVVDAGQHVLSLALPDEALVVSGDRHRLVQALANLLVNAAKYTPRGGRIALAVSAEADAVVLAVTDTGIGIAPERLGEVFELFTQVHDVQAMGQHGLGIGLALTRQIAELHGGSVEASSPGVGQGSRFALRLPRPH